MWAPFPQDSTVLEWPSGRQWILNSRCRQLDWMLEQLRSGGVAASEETFEDVNGSFGHCLDPEGNRIRLWQPNQGM